MKVKIEITVYIKDFFEGTVVFTLFMHHSSETIIHSTILSRDYAAHSLSAAANYWLLDWQRPP